MFSLSVCWMMYGYFMEMLHINHFSWIFLLLCRFNTHETQTMPIIEHYEKLGLVKKIQAIKSPSEVDISSFNNNRQLMSLTWHLLVVIKINLLFSTNIAKYCTTFFFSQVTKILNQAAFSLNSRTTGKLNFIAVTVNVLPVEFSRIQSHFCW